MAISMTGFGSADLQWESWSCQVEIRSVNQRFLDIRCRIPLGFQNLEQDFKKKIKAFCTRGKIDCSVRLEEVVGEEKLKLYQYHTKVANHYFCSVCGIYTHHNPRSAPAMTGFNLGCVDEVKVEDLKDIAFFDGLNHPMDKK